MKKSAIFSDCGKHRFSLTREWSNGENVLFIMLNPSLADSEEDDRTINRAINFAQSWGYGSLTVCNLFSLVTPFPSELIKSDQPNLSKNDEWIEDMGKRADKIIAAWGVYGNSTTRAKEVIKRLPNLHVLKLSKNGSPRHPLYIHSNTAPSIWHPKL